MRRLARVLALAIALLTQGASLRAHAQNADASSLFADAQRAEATGDSAAALDAYRAIVETSPTSRLAARASRRLAWLEERNDDPAALSALLAFLSQTPRDADAIVAFAARVQGMPPGIVRRESRIALATDWDRLSSAAPDDAALSARAEDAYLAALDEPTYSLGERQHLTSSYASLLARIGRAAEASALLESEGRAGGSLYRRLAFESIDRWLRPLAWSLVVLLAALAVTALGRAWRASPRELGGVPSWSLLLFTVLYTAGTPYALGAWYSREAEHALSLLSPALLATLIASGLLGRALAALKATPRARWGAACLAVLASLAATYLALFDAGDGPLSH